MITCRSLESHNPIGFCLNNMIWVILMRFFKTQDRWYCKQMYLHLLCLLCGASALLQNDWLQCLRCVQVWSREAARAHWRWTARERMPYLLESWHSRRILLQQAPLRSLNVPSQVEEVRTAQVKPVLLVPSHAVAAWYSSPAATPSCARTAQLLWLDRDTRGALRPVRRTHFTIF